MAEWLPLFPLQDVVLFPGTAVPLRIFEPRYVSMVRERLAADRRFGIVLIRGGEEVGEPAVPEDVGTVARIEEVRELDDDQYLLIASGQERFRLLQTRRQGQLLVGLVEPFDDLDSTDDDLDELADVCLRQGDAYFNVIRQVTGGMMGAMKLPSDAPTLSFVVAASLQVPARQRQDLLELTSLRERLERLIQILVNQTASLSERLRVREDLLQKAVTNGKPPAGHFGEPTNADG